MTVVNWGEWRPTKIKVEFCKLHSRPLTECIAQHKEP
jgi:hypothetical protein